MGILDALNSILNPIFSPLLKLPPALTILIIAFVITLIITLIYKYTTDQKKLKHLKEEMKENQKKIRELSKKDPQKAMEMNKRMWSSQGTFFKQSMKPVIYTFIPLIIIFGWLNTHMGYYQLEPNQPFEVTAFFGEGHAASASLSALPELEVIGNSTQGIVTNEEGKEAAVWELKGAAGEYLLTINYNNEEYKKELIITSEREYKQPEKKISDSKLKKIVVGNEKIYPLKDLLGWKLNWLWTYIIFSFLISLGLRKLMKVY